MADGVEPGELTDDEVVALLREADRDEREGRLVRCDTEEELRAFIASLHPRPREPGGARLLPAD